MKLKSMAPITSFFNCFCNIFEFSVTHSNIYRLDKYTFSMRSTRKTKKMIRWTIDSSDAFTTVELVKFMEDALKKPRNRYQVKMRIEGKWDHRDCKYWEKEILSEPHWKNLEFRYSKPSRSFLFTRRSRRS